MTVQIDPNRAGPRDRAGNGCVLTPPSSRSAGCESWDVRAIFNMRLNWQRDVMAVRLDPLISEFETEDQASRYDAWFRAKVREAMTSDKPRVPHDEAMARVEAGLEE